MEETEFFEPIKVPIILIPTLFMFILIIGALSIVYPYPVGMTLYITGNTGLVLSLFYIDARNGKNKNKNKNKR